jgi:hypothetical protein
MKFIAKKVVQQIKLYEIEATDLKAAQAAIDNNDFKKNPEFIGSISMETVRDKWLSVEPVTTEPQGEERPKV